MEAKLIIADRFSDFMFDWDYERYVVMGGYGSGKSHHIVAKIVLKCLQEKRKVLVMREVFSSMEESCFDLFLDVLTNMNLLADENIKAHKKTKVISRKSPMQLKFPNGSRIIFKGMDKADKLKSLHGVSIVWLEEANEIKYAGYLELQGRLRTKQSMHFIMSFNPVGRETWPYRQFFERLDEKGNKIQIIDERKFYEKRTLVANGTYYHHSTPDDNPFLPHQYLRRLDDIKTYDPTLHRIARYGKFGPTGLRVLPQFTVAKDAKDFTSKVRAIEEKNHYFGMDFGFEESYNAVISMAVDQENSVLYIYDEIYENKITDDKFAVKPEMLKVKDKLNAMKERKIKKAVVADNEDPKAITYYRNNGFMIRGCRNKFAGSRLSNTRKVKRFKKIVCSPKCINTIRELSELVYKTKPNGDVIYDQFNIDPHTFSAIWYGLDTVTVADLKERKTNSKRG